ncbi:MAG: hypothetical protein LBJ11_10180 [Oscillospiraceae bacterium]|nr:hypothetical protein [Oscillospiraceae bacterium]
MRIDSYHYDVLNAAGDLLWLWRREDLAAINGFSNFSVSAIASDHRGGLLLLGHSYDTEKAVPLVGTLCRVAANGQVLGFEPFAPVPDSLLLEGWPGTEEDYWVIGSANDGHADAYRYLAHLDKNLQVIGTFALQESQYPWVCFLPEADRIVLYCQCYHYGEEYGAIYALDTQLNQLAYLEFPDDVPSSVARLRDGRWVVTFFRRSSEGIRDCVRIYDAAWNQIRSIDEIGFTEVTALDDGGFALIGSRLSPGQPSGALYINSVQPKMDLIYHRYDTAGELVRSEIFAARDSRSGYGYAIARVDEQGTLGLYE